VKNLKQVSFALAQVKVIMMSLLLIASGLSAQVSHHADISQTLDAANLATVCALRNTIVADSINKIPLLFFGVAKLISTDGEIRSVNYQDNALAQGYEKFTAVSVGILLTENSFEARAFQTATAQKGRSGKIALYADTLFKKSVLLLRWRKLTERSEFFVRSIHHEEKLILNRNTSGEYEKKEWTTGKIRRHIIWTSEGAELP
jgi:hypothetical protein